MDRNLLQSHARFKARAAAQPTVEKRPAKHLPSSAPPPKRPLVERPRPSSHDYRGSHVSSTKFSYLSKIVNFLRTKHQGSSNWGLRFDELLEEARMADIPSKIRTWLATEALPNNPKVKVVDEKFFYQPKYEISSRKELKYLLKDHSSNGRGGVMMTDVEESLPNAKEQVEKMKESVLKLKRPHDKAQVLFYNDPDVAFSLEDEVKQLWRGVSVEGVDEKTIEEYLEKQGIVSFKDTGAKKVAPNARRRGNKKTNKSFKKLNDHIHLNEYNEGK